MSKECKICAKENDDSAVKCIQCGADFDSNGITTAISQIPTPILTLTDKRTGKEFKINSNCTIGREGDIEPEYFSNNMHVSREHCKIISDNGEFRIEHLSSVNPTKIDGIALSKGLKKAVKNGNVLSIADLDFTVSISKNEPAIKTSVQNNETPAIVTYVIICPNCGYKHIVSDLNTAIDECIHCGDDKKSRKIAKERAVIENAS